MRGSHLRGWAACLLGALALAGPASAERFVYRYRPGQLLESRAALAGASMIGPTTGTMMRAQFRARFRVVQRVISVSGGVVTLEVREIPIGGKLMAFGREEAYTPEPSRSIVRMTERGRFISRKRVGEPKRASAAGMPDPTDVADVLYGLNFPDRDLKPGDTWEETFTIGEEEPQSVQMSCRYVGRETFRGRNCARIAVTLSTTFKPHGAGPESMGAPPASGRLTAQITTYFDPQAGVEVYSRGSLVLVLRADLSSVSPEGGEFAGVTKINMVQILTSGAGK